MQAIQLSNEWLVYCRPGFENEAAAELLDHAPGKMVCGEGWVRVRYAMPYEPRYNKLIFARQLLKLHLELPALPERDRLSPIVEAMTQLNSSAEDVWLESADTNDGKSLSSFFKKFGQLLLPLLQEKGVLGGSNQIRYHLFFINRQHCLIGETQSGNRSDWLMGIPRLRMPVEAPSRSTLKLAEAFMTLLPPEEQETKLRTGMKAVDLGAAPGGWSWQFVSRGIKVIAVDNGPMKGVMDCHPLVEHRREDGFRYKPRQPVDWLVCDMVEQPIRIAGLMATWFETGMTRHAVFNFKLPMKKRTQALEDCFLLLQNRLRAAGLNYTLRAKQLYHDREEITCYLGVESARARRKTR